MTEYNNNKDRLRTESSYVFAFITMIPGGYNAHPMNAGGGGGGVFFLIAKQRCERWSRRLRTSGYHSPHTPVPHSPVLLRSPGRHHFGCLVKLGCCCYRGTKELPVMRKHREMRVPWSSGADDARGAKGIKPPGIKPHKRRAFPD